MPNDERELLCLYTHSMALLQPGNALEFGRHCRLTSVGRKEEAGNLRSCEPMVKNFEK